MRLIGIVCNFMILILMVNCSLLEKRVKGNIYVTEDEFNLIAYKKVGIVPIIFIENILWFSPNMTFDPMFPQVIYSECAKAFSKHCYVIDQNIIQDYFQGFNQAHEGNVSEFIDDELIDRVAAGIDADALIFIKIEVWGYGLFMNPGIIEMKMTFYDTQQKKYIADITAEYWHKTGEKYKHEVLEQIFEDVSDYIFN